MKYKALFGLSIFLASCTSLQKSGLINARGNDYLKAELVERTPTPFMPKYKTLYDIPNIKSFPSSNPAPIEYPQLSFIPDKKKNITNIKSNVSISSGSSVSGEPMLKIKAPLSTTFDVSLLSLGTWHETLIVERNEDYGKIILLTYQETPLKIKISTQSNYSMILIGTVDEEIYLFKDTATRDILLKFELEFKNNLAQEFNKLSKNKIF